MNLLAWETHATSTKAPRHPLHCFKAYGLQQDAARKPRACLLTYGGWTKRCTKRQLVYPSIHRMSSGLVSSTVCHMSIFSSNLETGRTGDWLSQATAQNSNEQHFALNTLPQHIFQWQRTLACPACSGYTSIPRDCCTGWPANGNITYSHPSGNHES